MPLAKLFKITDLYGQRWHVTAPSFGQAIDRMKDWEQEPYADLDAIVKSVERVEDIIVDGSRQQDVGEPHVDVTLYPPTAQRTDWTLANNMADAAESLLEMLTPTPDQFEEHLRRVDALRAAVEKYQDIPF